MQRYGTMRIIFRLLLIFCCLISSPLPGYAADLTQRDWMITLVDTLGWSYGLPDEPQDPDYINILTGNRSFRFEAEDIYDQEKDNVSLLSFRNFGAYSGRGWLHGTREPTETHLRFNLPVDGVYRVKARLRQAGHLFAFHDVVKAADAKPEFTDVAVGSFLMQSGPQEIILTLPANGSIDSLTLEAPALAAITPVDGWQPDEPLTWDVIQTTMLQLLHLAEVFPASSAPLVIEAEGLGQTNARVVSIPHLGRPSGGKWLRAGPLPTEVSFPVKLEESGFYDLSLRAMGTPISILVGGHQEITLKAKPYLEDYTFRPLFFFAGNNNITLTLPPGGGVDQLTLTGRQVTPTKTTTLLGTGQNGLPNARDLDSLTSLLAAFGVER